MKNTKNLKNILIGVIIIIVIAIGIYAFNRFSQKASPLVSDSTSVSVDSKTYINSMYTVEYPASFEVKDMYPSYPNTYMRFNGPMTDKFFNSFEIKISSTTDNLDTTIEKVMKLYSGNAEKTSLEIDGVAATRLDFADDKARIHNTRIFLRKGNYTYTIYENGPLYYKSAIFEKFYQSIKFTK